ncbi:LAME_0H02740g1_1 [Lachancea meyersii CBS 8951]|uniref:Nuclear distribution protein PAC1 n=1 Tax=Lachancea meyersii CBS 8951 TaxID=1266667 RepID=A0A1G4KDN6_9SACH|nr:LAME_0H02740g1_1 [Lachancea meyersii CBS 8951]
MSLLPNDQRQLLHKCLLKYVRNYAPKSGPGSVPGEGMADEDVVMSSLAKWLEVDLESLDDKERPVDASLLPRKWNSIVRLQRRIIELEKHIQELTEENEILLENGPVSLANKSSLTWIPREQSKLTISCGAPVSSVKLHPELPLLFVATDTGKLQCYDLMNHSMPIASLQAHMRGITSIDVHLGEGSECYVVTTSKDLYCKVFRLMDSQLHPIRSLAGHEHVVSQVCMWKHGTDTLVATCSRDMTCKVWDVANGWCLKSFQPHGEWVRSLDIAGDYVVTGSNDCTVRLSHWPSGRGLSFGFGHTFPIERVKIIPMLRSTDNTDEQQNKYNTLNQEYADLGFSHVITASRDNSIRIWQVPLPKIVAHRPPQPDLTRQHFTLITTLQGHTSWVRDLCIRGKYLISCGDDRTIRVWNLSTDELVRVINSAHDGFVNCIHTDSDGLVRQIMASGGADGKVKVFIK